MTPNDARTAAVTLEYPCLAVLALNALLIVSMAISVILLFLGHVFTLADNMYAYRSPTCC